MFSRIGLLAAFFAGALLTFPTHASTASASSLVGRVVVTPQGELLGRVEDIAVNVEEGRIDFVVVSIGSFLVDDNLIAVDPDALGNSADGDYLVVYSDDLDSARRFGADNWPDHADVLPSKDRMPVTVKGNLESGSTANTERLATISDGRRTATMKAGEREAQFQSSSTGKRRNPQSGVQYKRFTDGKLPSYLADSEFDRLDEDQDGYLSRSEIGERLRKGVRYQDYDVDGNDGIDPFEFQLLKEGA